MTSQDTSNTPFLLRFRLARWVASLPGRWAATIGLLLYAALTAPYAWREISVSSAGSVDLTAILTAIIALPIFAFAASWIWIELKMGRRLMPHLPVNRRLDTVGQRATERRALFVGLPIAAFIPLAPALAALLSGNTFGISAFAAPFAWLWITYILGPRRMQQAMILLMGLDKSDSLRGQEVGRISTALALEKDIEGDVLSWSVTITSDLVDGVPEPRIKAEACRPPSDPGGPKIYETYDLLKREDDAIALLGLVDKKADPYRLIFALSQTITFADQDLSSHEKIACLQTLKKARDRVPSLRYRA